MFEQFTPNWRDEAGAKAAYEAHNAAVRATIPASRLVEWHPGDGWESLCDALDVAVPESPFPHVNTTADFHAMTGLE
jgi:Sulfotransferase domain